MKFHPDGRGEGKEEIIIDFTPPFKRIPMIEGLEQELGVKLPMPLE